MQGNWNSEWYDNEWIQNEPKAVRGAGEPSKQGDKSQHSKCYRVRYILITCCLLSVFLRNPMFWDHDQAPEEVGRLIRFFFSFVRSCLEKRQTWLCLEQVCLAAIPRLQPEGGVDVCNELNCRASKLVYSLCWLETWHKRNWGDL